MRIQVCEGSTKKRKRKRKIGDAKGKKKEGAYVERANQALRPIRKERKIYAKAIMSRRKRDIRKGYKNDARKKMQRKRDIRKQHL